MPLWIKLDIKHDGKVYAWQSEDGIRYPDSNIFGYSAREAILKLADKMQRQTEQALDQERSR